MAEGAQYLTLVKDQPISMGELGRQRALRTALWSKRPAHIHKVYKRINEVRLLKFWVHSSKRWRNAGLKGKNLEQIYRRVVS